VKKDYLNKDDGVNLVTFFDKNTENLNGVFASCIDRMYEITKIEKRAMKGSYLAIDLGTNRFWMDQSCFAYIKMMEKLIQSSKTARNQFYSFLTEGQNDDEEDIENEVESELENNESYDDVAEGVGRRVNMKGMHQQNFTSRNDREKLIGTLMRIQHDILLFLASSPAQKPIWWTIHIIYQMLCSFFKNLCEHNCLDFKNYLGSFVPKVQDKAWNEENHTCMQIFGSQLQFLMDSSNLAENRNTVMIHSD